MATGNGERVGGNLMRLNIHSSLNIVVKHRRIPVATCEGCVCGLFRVVSAALLLFAMCSSTLVEPCAYTSSSPTRMVLLMRNQDP